MCWLGDIVSHVYPTGQMELVDDRYGSQGRVLSVPVS